MSKSAQDLFSDAKKMAAAADKWTAE